MTDIFLSYSRLDSQRIAKLVECLSAFGLTVWWDRSLEQDSRFARTIEAQITLAKIAVVCWSAAAKDSDWVRAESHMADGQNKYFGCVISHGEPAMPYNQRQVVDLRGWDETADHTDFLRLLAALGQRLDRKDLIGLKEAVERREQAERLAEAARAKAESVKAAKQKATQEKANELARYHADLSKAIRDYKTPRTATKWGYFVACLIMLFFLSLVYPVIAAEPSIWIKLLLLTGTVLGGGFLASIWAGIFSIFDIPGKRDRKRRVLGAASKIKEITGEQPYTGGLK